MTPPGYSVPADVPSRPSGCWFDALFLAAFAGLLPLMLTVLATRLEPAQASEPAACRTLSGWSDVGSFGALDQERLPWREINIITSPS